MPEMKDSGIEWIGMIPKNWNVDKIKYHLKRNEPKNPGNVEVLSVYREYGVIPKNSRDDNHNITSEDTSKYKYVKKGDLVINKMKAWQGSMGVSEYEGIVSPAYFIYNFTDNYFDKKYFHFLIRNCYKDEFRRISGGIREGQWDLSADLFADELVLIPPIKEQIKILEFLNTKCAEIDTLYSDIEKQIETLEEYKKSIITEAVTRGLDPDVEMKDSGIEWIGMIPKHWNLKRLGFASVMQNGYVGATQDILVDDGERYIQSLHIKDGQIMFGNDFFVTKEWGEKHPKMYKGDILVVQTGDIGQVAIVDDEYDGCNCHALIICHVDNVNFVSQFLLYYLMSYAGNRELIRYQTGTTLKHLNSSKIKYSKMVVPPKDEQSEIVKHLTPIIREVELVIEDKKKQLETLEQYKRSLIYEYVTGKKEVK